MTPDLHVDDFTTDELIAFADAVFQIANGMGRLRDAGEASKADSPHPERVVGGQDD